MSKNLHNFKMYYYTQIFQVKKHRTLPKIYIYGSDEPTITQKSQKLSPRGVKIIKLKKNTENIHLKCLKIHTIIKCIIIHKYFKLTNTAHCQKLIYMALMCQR